MRSLAAGGLLLLAGGGLLCFIQLRGIVRGPEPAKRLMAAAEHLEYLGSGGVILQKGPFDCGPATLKMVLDHYRIPVSLESLERELMDSPKGTSMARMSAVARQKGLVAEGRRLDAREFSRIDLPSIALLDRRHYVVIAERTHDGELTILDPSLGRCRAREASFLKYCHGEVLVIRKLG